MTTRHSNEISQQDIETALDIVAQHGDDIESMHHRATDTATNCDPETLARVKHTLRRAAELGADPALDNLRNDALRRFNSLKPKPSRWYNKPLNAAKLVAAAASILLASVLYIATQLPFSGTTEDLTLTYQSDIGKVRKIHLNDGSIVELNTGSQITASFNAAQRQIRLDRGQALFDVAHDTSRPFVVTTKLGKVTAIGTSFDVRNTDSMLAVTLVTGKVKVELGDTNNEGSTKTMLLREGEQVISRAGNLSEVRQVNTNDITSWRKGMLVFDDVTLAEAVAEINRYSRKPIVFASETLADIRVSGAFKTTSSLNFAETLAAYYPLLIDTSAANEIVLRPK